jgi:hypothetical protein
VLHTKPYASAGERSQQPLFPPLRARAAPARQFSHSVQGGAPRLPSTVLFPVPVYESLEDGLALVWSGAVAISIALEFGGLRRLHA